ncbi:formimidoylglutamase [Bacillus sp. S/N-304-OC-R1]|uniref:formimidoylglutamase n=1 Tax=Bacillus sp. S/N-304-OC-R1 TaxID=2758034 RepID=UPI001C8D1FCC|nr:formimidoylglutamase [Bacillus sp. S/N-304-OC-R1]MBY0123323.1 formimidoylglutamase [Bacillus sp. S/N-304-OC-R1]
MYTEPSKKHWFGRTDSQTDFLSFRYHQKVNTSGALSQSAKKGTFGIIGFKCEAGVKRNKGRLGAAEAPEKIREALGKLPWHLPEDTDVLDAGDISCIEDEMEEAQAELGHSITDLLNKNVSPIILGGGHETFYGHYLGARQFIGQEAKLGIINIDAHFDMRPYDEQTSSGTMFKQILDSDSNSGYLCLGIQKYGNTRSLFETAGNYNVEYVLEEDMCLTNMDPVQQKIEGFISAHDYIILTLCTDVINSAFAPGVSAPSPFGLDPKLVRSLIRHIVSNEKALSFDISEVNPAVDENNRTVALAAQLVNEAIMNFHK